MTANQAANALRIAAIAESKAITQSFSSLCDLSRFIILLTTISSTIFPVFEFKVPAVLPPKLIKYF